MDNNNDNIAAPCGLFPRYFFNDTYDLTLLENLNLSFSEDGITWKGEKDTLFKPLSDEYTNEQKSIQKNYLKDDGTVNEHFISWIRVFKSCNI